MYRHVGGGMGLPKAVKSLLIANVAIFFITAVIRINWYGLFGLVPYLVTHKLFVWQFFTHMFLHGNMGHIFWNMFGLWMFGSELENNWGSKDFLQYYIICGIGGGILVWITSFVGLSNPIAPTIGASGAIFGILAAYGMMWPDRMIFVLGILPMRAINFVIIFGILNLMQGLTGTGGGIAVFAHVGGGVTGFIYLKFGWRIMAYTDVWWKRIRESFRAQSKGFKVVDGGRKSKGSGSRSSSDKTPHPDLRGEVDRILDKIAREGMDGLSDRERRILEDASKKRKR